MRIAHRRLALVVALALGAFSHPRTAAAVTPEEEKRAEALFDEGRALMQEAGRLDEACVKLEQSLRLYDRGDTALNLAECYSRQGRTATAWREFDRAIEHGAKVSFQEAIAIARQRRDELAAKLSRLAVVVPSEVANLEGLEVRLNGQLLPRDAWNEPDIRDPGPYEVVATAKGHVPFKASVALGPDKDEKTIQLALEKEAPPPAPPPKPPPPAPPPEKSSLPVWPFVVGGAGVAMLGVSTAFAIARGSAGSDLDEACGDDRQSCPASQRADLEDKRSSEQTSFGAFVGFGVGGVLAVGVGAVGLGIALAGDDRRETAVVVGPGTIGLRGAFR